MVAKEVCSSWLVPVNHSCNIEPSGFTDEAQFNHHLYLRVRDSALLYKIVIYCSGNIHQSKSVPRELDFTSGKWCTCEGQQWFNGQTKSSLECGVRINRRWRFAHEGHRTNRRHELGIYGGVLQDNK